METRELRDMLEGVARGERSVDDALLALRAEPFVDLGYAKPDTHRGIRQGVSEVIYGAGKSAEQIVGIVTALRAAGQRRVLVTRVDAPKAAAVRAGLARSAPSPASGDASRVGAVPPSTDELAGSSVTYHEDARLLVVGGRPEPDGNGYVCVCAAGTSDLYCAEEAALTAEMLGSRVRRLYDVGVSGLHRLLAHAGDVQGATAVVAVAGMEGALASVVGGLASCPVIAVPTSVGYGASLHGVAALLAMLNSCASGVSVVNIDNGFGAGYQASLIDHARTRPADGRACDGAQGGDEAHSDGGDAQDVQTTGGAR